MSADHEELHVLLLGMLRDLEPDNHLVGCSDTVLVAGSVTEPIPDPAGDGRWALVTWTLTCGHGKASVKFESHAHIIEDPEANQP